MSLQVNCWQTRVKNKYLNKISMDEKDQNGDKYTKAKNL